MAGTAGVVKGKNCVFMINSGSGYKPIVCAKSFSVSIMSELKETTSRGSGAYIEYDYKSLSHKLTLSGLIKAIDLDGDPIFFDVAFYQMGFLSIEYKAIYTDDNLVIKTIRGTALVRTSDFGASAGQLADSTIDLQGTGEFYIDDDAGAGCSNSISGVIINGGSVLTNGANIFLLSDADLNITIESLANPSIQIFRYNYELDDNGKNSEFTDSTLPYVFPEIEMGGVAVGSHVLKIWPVCDNGVEGSLFTINVGKIGPA